MSILSNKNHPTFNLKDTFIYSKDFKTSPKNTFNLKNNKMFITPLKTHKKNFSLSEENSSQLLSFESIQKTQPLTHKKTNSKLPNFNNLQLSSRSQEIIDYLNTLDFMSKVDYTQRDFLKKLRFHGKGLSDNKNQKCTKTPKILQKTEKITGKQ